MNLIYCLSLLVVFFHTFANATENITQTKADTLVQNSSMVLEPITTETEDIISHFFNINPTGDAEPEYLTQYQHMVFFLADDGV